MRWLEKTFGVSLVGCIARCVSLVVYRSLCIARCVSLVVYRSLRLHRARVFMLGDGLSAAEASLRVGYSSPSQFSREFKRLFGVPPSQASETASDGLFAERMFMSSLA